MDKFSLIIALCSCLAIARGEGDIFGNVKWNSSKKALTDTQISTHYRMDMREIHGIRAGVMMDTKEKIAMKLEDPDKNVCFLPQEVHVYEDLQKRAPNGNLLEKGFANLYGYGKFDGKRVFIMSKLGSDLLNYAGENNMECYKWDQLRFVATSAIDEIKFLHEAGYIHQDIKPENFMYGIEDPKKVDPKKNPRASFLNQVYLIDFGSSYKYRDENGTLYKQSPRVPNTVTTPPYYTRTFRKKLTQSRRDDMESLGYAFLVLSGVRLSWDGLNETAHGAEITRRQNELCEDLEVVPLCRASEMIDKQVQAAFSTYFFLLKQLFTAVDGFFQEPDYAAFKKCFGEDPKAYYFQLTAKKFEESAGVGSLMRRAAKRFSSSGKSKQKESKENPPKSSEQSKKKKK